MLLRARGTGRGICTVSDPDGHAASEYEQMDPALAAQSDAALVVAVGPYDAGALRALYRASGGVPRLVNVLAHKALLAAYGEGRHYVSAAHVDKAVSDTPAAKRHSTTVTVAVSAIAALSVFVFWYWVR